MVATELQNHLESEVLEVEYEAIAPHVSRDAVLLVRDDLPLVQAAMAVSLDAIDDVKQWMTDGRLIKVTTDLAQAWTAERPFRFLIVQPFVLIQDLSKP